MVNTIKKNKELLILIGILLAIGICAELPSWINGGYFVAGGDIKTQWYPFYVFNRRETINALKAGTFPFYSWILFLGNNIWSSMTSYGFVDIYNLLFYLCRENYFWIYDFQVILKIIVGGISFYIFIDYLLNNKKAAMFSAVLFSASSYLLHFSSQNGFLSFASLMPLYLIGIVKYIKENKKSLFIISTAILFLTNYYLFFSLTVLSPFIYIYCYYNIKKNLKGCFISMLKIMLLYFVGFMISAILTLPAALFLLQNTRLGDFEGSHIFYPSLKMYLHILNSFFTPNHLTIYGVNVFNFNEHTLKELCVYSSSIVILLVPQILTSNNKIFKYSTLCLYFISLLIFFIPWLGSFLNGFSEVCFRWTVLLIMLNSFVSSYILFIEKNYSKKISLIVIVCVSIILFITFFIGLSYANESFSNYVLQFIIICSVILFLFVYYFVLFIKGEKATIVVLIIELIVFTISFGVKSVPNSITKADLEGVNSVLSDEYSPSVKEYLNSLDDNNYKDFYRTYVDYESLYWSFSRNMNLLYGFEGVMSYDSTYEPSFSEMIAIKEKGIIKDIYWEYSIDDPDLLDFVSCKYALTLDENKIPFRNYEIIDNNYRGGIIVSENKDYQSIATTYSRRVDTADKDFSILKDNIVSEDSTIDKYLHSNNIYDIENVYYYNNQLEGDIYSDEDSFVILKISYDDGFNVKVNGEDVELYKCNGGMIGFPIKKGNNHIDVYFVPKGFKLGAILTVIGCAILVFIILFDKKIILKHKQHN